MKFIRGNPYEVSLFFSVPFDCISLCIGFFYCVFSVNTSIEYSRFSFVFVPVFVPVSGNDENFIISLPFVTYLSSLG